MLAPIKPWQFYLLSNSGWDLSRLLSAVVQELNGLENLQISFGLSAKKPPKSLAKFTQAIWLMEQLEINGSLKMTMSAPRADAHSMSAPTQTSTAGSKASTGSKDSGPESFGGLEYHLVFVESNMNDADRKASAQLKTLLGLDPDQSYFRLLPSRSVDVERETNGIVLSNRSMLSLLLYLAGGIKLPEPLSTEYPGAYDKIPALTSGEEMVLPSRMFNVNVQWAEPEDPFVAIRFNGYWFWIDKRDQNTKTTFSLVEYLLRLQQAKGSNSDKGVLLTIPTR